MAQITVDTGINTKPVLEGVKQINSAIESLKGAVANAGKSVDAISVGYTKAFINSKTATENLKASISNLETSVRGLRSQLLAMATTRIQNPEFKKLTQDIAETEKALKQLNATQRSLESQGANALEMRWERNADIILRNQQSMAPLGSQEYAAYEAAQKDMARMVANGEDQIVRTYQHTNEAIADAMNRRAELVRQQNEMRTRGKDTIYGFESEDYRNAESELTRLITQLNILRQTGTEALQPINTFKQFLIEAGQALKGLGKGILSIPVNIIRTLASAASTAASSFATLAGKVLNAAAGFAKMAASRIVSVLRQTASSALQAASNLARIAVKTVISELHRLADAAKKAATWLAKVAGSAIKSGLSSIASLAKKGASAILGLGKNAKKSNNSLKSAVTTLIRYAFGVRSIYMLVRKLRTALVTAFQNMAKKVPEVNKSLSKLASSLDRLKNSMATAFQPVLTAIEPYLTAFMDKLSDALTKVGMFFAALTGQKYVYKATKANIDYAKSLDKTKKSAKEAENQLASFDKLDILEDKSKDSNETETSNFEKVPVSSEIWDFVQKIKDWFKNGDLAKIGTTIADIVNTLVNKIKWEEIGKKIGNFINKVVDLYNAFMDGIDWENIGDKIADGLNGLLGSVDWEELGEAFSKKINAIFGILSGFVHNFDWDSAARALADALWGYFGSIDWVLIGETVGEGITRISTAITEFAEYFPWDELATKLANGANALFNKLDFEKIATALTTVINKAFASLRVFITTFDWTEHGKKLEKGIKKFIKDLDINAIGDTLKEAIRGVLKFITPALEDENLWKDLGDKLDGLLRTMFKVDEESGTSIWLEIIGKLKTLIFDCLISMLVILQDRTLFSEIGRQISEFFTSIFGDATLLTTIGKSVNELFWDALSLANGFLDGIAPYARTAANNIKAAIAEIDWPGIATETWNTIKKAFSTAGNFVDALLSENVTDEQKLKADSSAYWSAYVDSANVFNGKTIGVKLGTRIREAVSYIPWESIGKEMWETASKLLTQAGDFVKSLFGVTKADIDHEGNEAKAIGIKIGEKVADAISQIEWDKFGQQFETAVTTLFDAINGFFQGIGEDIIDDNGIKTTKLQKAITDFFSNVDWGKVATSIVSAAWSAFKNIGKALLGAIVGEDAQQDTKDTIEAFRNSVLSDLKSSFGEVEIDNIRLKIKENPEMEGWNAEQLNSYFNTSFNSFEWDAIINSDGIDSAVSAAWDEFEQKVTHETETVGRNSADSYINGVKDESAARKEEIKAAAEDAYCVPLTDPDLQSKAAANGKAITDVSVDAYVSETQSRQGEILQATEDAYLPSPEELEAKGYSNGEYIAQSVDDGFTEKMTENADGTKEVIVESFSLDGESLGRIKVSGKKSVQTHTEGMEEALEESEDTLKKGMIATMDGVVEAVDEGMNEAADKQSDALSTMESNAETAFGSMKTTAETGSTSMTTPLSDKWSELQNKIQGFLNTMSGDVSQGMGEMTGYAQQGSTDQREPVYENWDLIQTFVQMTLLTMQGDVQSGMSTMASTISSAMREISNMDWRYVGEMICSGLVQGMYNGWSWVTNTAWDLAYSAYQSALNALGIGSPSKMFAYLGEMTNAGLVEGMEDTESTVTGTVADIADSMIKTMDGTSLLAKIGVEDGGNLDGALTTFADKVSDSFASLIAKLDAIAASVTFRMPDIAAGTVVPYNVSSQTNGGSNGITEALTASYDDLASVVIQSTTNAALAIVDAIQKYNGQGGTGLTTNQVIDEINRRTRAMGSSPLLF